MNSNYRYICRGLYVPNLSKLKHAILALFLEKVGSYFFQAILILCLRSMEPKKVNGYHKCRHLRRNLDSWDPRRVIQVLETAPCNRRSILRIGLAALGQRLQYLGDENKLYIWPPISTAGQFLVQRCRRKRIHSPPCMQDHHMRSRLEI